MVLVLGQHHLAPTELSAHVVLSSYLILPWVTLIVLPIILWQRTPYRSLFLVAVATILMVVIAGIILWPNNIEGYDRALVVKSYLLSLLELLFSLISTALAFFIGSRSKSEGPEK